MSETIDERVVEMRFDNDQFENGAKTTIETLKNLKKGLQLDDGTKSLQNLEKVSKGFSLGSIADDVASISSRFSTMGIIGMTALQNITNSAINTEKQLISSLTLTPLRDGLAEYETQINAIQTILANTKSKGTVMADVTAALDELNVYADKTIYNFTEMTRNIGTFTAAGVGLNRSVQSIKGIANLAAVSGSTSYQAANAMYQLSQAIAAGTVKLMDWNSVVNAGMGGEVFQQALIRTAENMGIAANEIIKAEGSFRDSLSEGWLTSEVLTETLAQIAGAYDESALLAKGYTKEQAAAILELAQTAEDAATKVKTFTQLIDTLKEALGSGWTKSFELILGNFEEAQDLFTAVSDTLGGFVNASSDARNAILAGWSALGGRNDLIAGVVNLFWGLVSVIAVVKTSFEEIFPPVTAKTLADLTKRFREFAAELVMDQDTADALNGILKGLFSVIKAGVIVISSAAKATEPLWKAFVKLASAVLGIAGYFGNAIADLVKFAEASGYIDDVILSISSSLEKFVAYIENCISKTSEFIAGFSGLTSVESAINSVVETIKKIPSMFGNATDDIGEKFNVIDIILKGLSSAVDIIGSGIKAVFEGVMSTVFDMFSNFNFGTVANVVNAGLLVVLYRLVKKFFDSIKNLLTNGGEALKPLREIASNASEAIGTLQGSLESFQTSLKANTLLEIAVAIGILALAVSKLSSINSGDMEKALSAMTIMFIELFASMVAMEKVLASGSFKGLTSLSVSIIALSVAVLVLSSALTKISSIDSWESLAKGLVGIAGAIGVLVIAANNMSSASIKLIVVSVGLIAFAAAINILSSAVIKLGGEDFSTLAKGLASVGMLCTELALFLNNADLDGLGILKGTGLVLLATSITILSSAVSKLGGLSLSEIAKGLGSIGALLAEIDLFMSYSVSSVKMLATSVGMTILASSMLIFESAISALGNLTLSELAKGLGGMAVALTEITIAVNLMPTGMISKAVALLGIASSLTVLVSALRTMGSMSWSELAISLVALAGSLTIIGVALAFMQTSLAGSTAMIAMAAALTVLSGVLQTFGNMRFAEIGVGLLSLAGMFTVIGVAGTFLTPLTPILLALAAAISSFGGACLAVGVGTLAFAIGLTALAASGMAGVQALASILETIVTFIPQVAAEIANGVIEFAKVIGEGAPTIANSVATVLLTIIQTIALTVPQIVATVSDMLLAMLALISSYLPKFVDAGFNLIVSFIGGLSNTIDAHGSELVDAVERLIVSIIATLAEAVVDVVSVAASLVLAFASEITSKFSEIKDLAFEFINIFLDGIKGKISDVVDVGADVVNGLKQGIENKISDVVGKSKELGSALLSGLRTSLDIHSPSEETKAIGENVAQGLINGGEGKCDEVKRAGEFLGNSYLNPIMSAYDKVSDLFSSGKKNTTLGNAGNFHMIDNGKEIPGAANSASDMTTSLGKLEKASSGAAKSTKDMTEKLQTEAKFMQYATQAVTAYANNYGHLSNIIGDTSGVNSAIQAIEQLAIATYEAEQATGGAAQTAEEASDRIYEIKKSFVEMFEEIQSSVANATKTFEDFEYKLSKSSGEITKAMKSQSAGMESFTHDLNLMVEKGFNSGLIKAMAEDVPTALGVMGGFLSMTAEQVAAANELFIQNGTITTDWTAQIMAVVARAKMQDTMMSAAQENIANATTTAANDITTANNQLIDSMAQVGEAATAQREIIETQYEAMKQSIAEVVESQIDMFSSFNRKSELMLPELMENMASQYNGAMEWADMLGDLSGKGLSNDMLKYLADLGQNGYGYVKELVKATNEDINYINAQYEMLQNLPNQLAEKIGSVFKEGGMFDVAGLTQQATNAGVNFTQGFANGIASQMQTAAQYSSQLGLGSLNALQTTLQEKSPSKATALMGTNFVAGFSNAIKASRTGAIQAVSVLGDASINKLKSYEEQFHTIGKNMVDGMSKGISSGKAGVLDSIGDVADSAIKRAKRLLDINSPSGVFEKIGKYSDEGLARGFTKYASLAVAAVEFVTGRAISAAEGVSADISKWITEGMDSTPTIRPVLDLSGVSADVGTMDRMIGGSYGANRYGIDTSGLKYRYATTYTAGPTASGTINMSSDNRDIINAISSLGERIDRMGDSMKNLQIVMDTGATVGALESTIDRRLGQRAVRAGRGN